MSPRRKIDPADGALLATPAPRPPREWRLLVVPTLAALVMVGSITMCAWMLYSHVSDHRTEVRQVAALDFVRSFTAEFLSPDPTGENGANRYVDRMTAQASGEFAQWWQDSRNDILIQIARGPVVNATILDAGVERWNDDGSVEVLVVAKTSIKGVDGKTAAEPTVRCLETARQEGDRWTISNLSPVI